MGIPGFACPEAQVTRAQLPFPAVLLACAAGATFDEETHSCGVSSHGSEYRRSASPRGGEQSLRLAPEGRQPSLLARGRPIDPADRCAARDAGRNALDGFQHDDQPAKTEVQGNGRVGYGVWRGGFGQIPRERVPATW